MTDLPTTKEELERKCIETLTLCATQLERGALDKRSAWVTAKTVWTLTAGLVDESISSLAAQMADENNCPGYRRYFIGKQPTLPPLILVTVPGRAFALIKVDPTNGERTTLKQGQKDPGDLEEHIAKMVSSLLVAGYLEI